MRTFQLLLLAHLALASASLAQRADRRVDDWIKAAGGPDVWDRVHTLEYTITTIWYDSAGREVRRRPRYVRIEKLPGAFRVRVERDEVEGRYVQIWDGARGRATLNGTELADSARAVREVAYVAGELVYWMGLPWKLRDPGVRIAEGEPNSVQVSFDRGVGLHDGDRYWYYWGDEGSPFPTEVHYIEQGRTDSDRQRILWSEWKHIGPATYAGKRLLVDAGGRPVRGFLITDVVVNRRKAASER